MSLSYEIPEKLGPKKVISKTTTISTINIGVEDFMEPNHQENAPSSTYQRPPRRSSSSVHFNMPTISTKSSPCHTIQTNKTSIVAKASNVNGLVHDTNSLFSSTANRGKKYLENNLTLPMHRDINPFEVFPRQLLNKRTTPLSVPKQRPSTAEASCERSSQGKNNILQHNPCELQENSRDECKSTSIHPQQKIFLSQSSLDPLQIPSRQDKVTEFGINMQDMTESLKKIEELIFPSKVQQKVVMRANMAFEASPMHFANFPEVEEGSIKPLCRSPLARSYFRDNDCDLENSKGVIGSSIRKQRRAQSVVKGRKRKDRCHEKSQSCDNEMKFREEVTCLQTKVGSSGEFSSSSLPLYANPTNSNSVASTDKGTDEPTTCRRWPKVSEYFSSSIVRSCKDHSTSKSGLSFLNTNSATIQIETKQDVLAESSDTSSKAMDKSLDKIGKSWQSKLEKINLPRDGIESGHKMATTISKGENAKLSNMVFNEMQNKGFEEENEVLCKTVCFDTTGLRIEQIYGNNKKHDSQLAEELKCNNSMEDACRKDSAMIVLPTTSISYEQATNASKTTLAQVEQGPPKDTQTDTNLLFPTKEVQEHQKHSSNNMKLYSICSSEMLQEKNDTEDSFVQVEGLSGQETSPRAKIQIHAQSSENILPHKHLSFHFEGSSFTSESTDEKYVDSSRDEHHKKLDSKSGNTFDDQCNNSYVGSLKMSVQKSNELQDNAPSSTLQTNQVEEKFMHTSLSTEKLCSILSYLGQVEQSNLQENLGVSTKKGCFYSPKEDVSPRAVLDHAEDAISLTSSSQTTHSSFHLFADVGLDSRPYDCNPSIAPTTIFDGVRKKVQELKQKITEQDSKIAQSRAENDRLIQEREKHLLTEREKYHKQLDDQAAEYKVIIQHHLSVNEKMLQDKEQLSEKCCNLAGNLSVTESKFDEKVKQLSGQWSHEMKKAKELWAVGEKQRQKQWQEKKVKDLKETAIRGLEPHLDNLNEKHRQELAKVESRHGMELQDKLDAQNLDCRRQMCELRDHLQQERDKMLDNERLAAHSRMAEVAEKFEQQAIQQRMRVATEITAQLERSEASRREDKQYSQELLTRLQKETSEREETLRKQMEKNLQELEMKKDRQIEHLKAKMLATAHQFQQKFNDHVTEGLKEKEKGFLAKLTKERDEQIELVIEKLESEKENLIAQNKHEVMEKVNEVVVAKCEVEQELKELKSKYNELSKATLSHKAATDLELEKAQKKMVSWRVEIQNQARVTDELHNQVLQYKTLLKNQGIEFEARLKDEHLQLQKAKSDLLHSHSQADEMHTRKAEELAEVEARVRQAIVKKDGVIASLREQLVAAHGQIKATEFLLQREHNEFIRES